MKVLSFLSVLFLLTSNSYGQRLSLEKLNSLLNMTMDKAEESLFLLGYSFSGSDSTTEKGGLTYNFSNKKATIGTAKRVAKFVHSQNRLESFVRYTTYDRGEFEDFRRSMISGDFKRDEKDAVSENSNYSKENLEVSFRVTTDQYENPTFLITLSNSRLEAPQQPKKKLNLKEFIRQKTSRGQVDDSDYSF